MKKILFLSLLFLMFFANNCFALYVKVTPDDSPGFVWTYFHFDRNNDGSFDDPSGTSSDQYDAAMAGEFNLDFGDTIYSSPFYNSYGFCVDLLTGYGSGSASIVDITTDNMKKAAWVLDSFWTDTNTAKQNAGIQLAVWDFVYSPATDNFDRFVPLTTSDKDTPYFWYNEYITSLTANYPSQGFDSSNYKIVNFDDSLQNMITTTPVPEPATMLLFGIGLLGLSAIGRKRS